MNLTKNRFLVKIHRWTAYHFNNKNQKISLHQNVETFRLWKDMSSNVKLQGKKCRKKDCNNTLNSLHHKLTQIIILPLLFQPEKQFCCYTRPDTEIQTYWASTYYQQCTRRLGCQQTSSLFSSVSIFSFMSSYFWFPKKYLGLTST
jgi:hypothetical protein